MIQLLPHQQRVMDQTADFNNCAHYITMGGGKTFTGSEKLISFGTDYNVVVCQKSKVEDWVNHFRTYYDLPVIDYTKPKAEIRPGIIIINYDIVWRRPEFKKLTVFSLLLDESSCIKNPTSNRTKFVMKSHATNVVLLSGTPTGGKYEELVTQCNLLGWKISKTEFWKRFVKFYEIERTNGYGFKYKAPIATGYKNVDELKRIMREHGAVFMTTEEMGISLPEQVHQVINVKSTANYRKFAKDLVLKLPDIEFIGDRPLTELLALRQLASGYNPNKWAAVNDLLESTNDRVIIFYNFKHEFEGLKKLVNKLKRHISYVNGDGRKLTAYEEHSDSVTLIQYQAGAMGLNLQKARHMVFYSLTQSSELFEQAKKRTHRIGQDRTCFYYYLLTADSVDYKIKEVLEMRQDYSAELFRNVDTRSDLQKSIDAKCVEQGIKPLVSYE